MRKVSPVHLPIPTRFKSSQCVCPPVKNKPDLYFCRMPEHNLLQRRKSLLLLHTQKACDMTNRHVAAFNVRFVVTDFNLLEILTPAVRSIHTKGARSTKSTTDSNQSTQGQGVQTVHFQGHLSPVVITSRHPDRFLAKGLGHDNSLKTYSDIPSLKFNLFSNLTAYKRSHVSAFPLCDDAPGATVLMCFTAFRHLYSRPPDHRQVAEYN